jgi:hypothetical protein
MFYKLLSVISQQDLDTEVDIELLRKEGIFTSDQECDNYFISANNTTIKSGNYSVCCHGLSNYNSKNNHVKLITWRLFGLLVFLYHSECEKKYSLINTLVNIIQNNSSKSDIHKIKLFVSASSVDLDFNTTTRLSVFLFQSPNKNVCNCTGSNIMNTNNTMNNFLNSVNTNQGLDTSVNDSTPVINTPLNLPKSILDDQLSDVFYNKREDEETIIKTNRCKLLNTMFNKLNNIVNKCEETHDLDSLTKAYYLMNIMSQDYKSNNYFTSLSGEFEVLSKSGDHDKQTKKILKYESDNSDDSDDTEICCSEHNSSVSDM